MPRKTYTKKTATGKTKTIGKTKMPYGMKGMKKGKMGGMKKMGRSKKGY